MKKILFGICISIFAMFSYGVVNAATVTLDMPTVVMNVPQGSSDNYYVTLESLNANNPMPANNQKMTIAIQGNNEGRFGSVTYNEPGYYYYKFYQDNTNLKDIKYDATTYELTVQIVQEEGGVLKANTALKKTGSNNKYTVVTFANLDKNANSDKKSTPGKRKSSPGINNPYTGDKIVKYFIISIISILFILTIIIYIKTSRDDD